MSKNEQEDVNKRLQEVKRRAEAKLAGSEAEVEKEELSQIGFRVKTV